MSKQRYEYKVAFVDFRGRVSIEGEENLIEEGERMTAFGRRYLNALGEQGWELVGIHMHPMGNAFHVFKRALAEGEQAEPAKPIERHESADRRPRFERFERFERHAPGFGEPPPGGHAGHPGHPPPPPPPPHDRPGDERDVFFRYVRRGPDMPGPEEFNSPLPD